MIQHPAVRFGSWLSAVSVALVLFTGCAKEPKEPPPLPKAPALDVATVQLAVTAQPPSVLTGADVADSTIYSESFPGGNPPSSGNYGHNPAFCIGRNNTVGCGAGGNSIGARRAVIRFALPTAPAGQAIFGGTMTLYFNRGVGGFNMNVLQLAQPFNEGSVQGADQSVGNFGPCGHHGDVTPSTAFESGSVSWNIANGAAWSTPGGSVTGTTAAAQVAIVNTQKAFTWNISQILRNWYGGQANNGVLLMATTNTTDGTNVENTGVTVDGAFNTREHLPEVTPPPNPPEIPRIDVEFRDAGGTACNVTNDCAFGLTCVGNICCQVASCDDSNACTADSCGGANGTCVHTNTVTCTASDQCHDVGTCQPATGTCSNPVKAGTPACNDGNACTTGETCQSGTCTGGTPTVCVASDQCHDVGTCNTGTGVCSNPVKAGTPACNDNNACTTGETCQAGTCTGGANKVCVASDQCHDVGTCAPATGICSNPVKAGTPSCDDGNACTTGETCQAGTCTGGAPKVCAASDQCHDAGTCNTSTGVCSNPIKAGTPACNDANACTTGETCQSGVCTGGTPTVCTASDQCHDVGTCNTGTGICSNPAKAGTPSCNDGNACTNGETCQSGTCTGGTPTVCTASDQCHDVGTCNTGTGVCSNPVKAGTPACNDNNACTTGETCQAGTCTGGAPTVCTASDQCHDVGVCNTSTGGCSNPVKAGTPVCDDGNACTSGERCQTGVCTGGTGTVCPTPDQCHDPGVCNTTTGVCSNPAKAGTPACNDANACTTGETCQAGTCTGGTNKVCTASDQCHDPGTCNTATGVCSNPAKAGTPACNDGNACTNGETCQSGACTGGTLTTCSASDQCHDPGTCNTTTGACSNPAKAGTPACNDGNACTTGETCQSGVCTGGSGTVCTASDQCHNAGTCDTATGVCSNPIKTGTPACNDGNACTTGETCQSGVCTGGTGKVCTASDQCHDVGTCDTGTGVCSNPAKAGTPACNDGNACTSGETCQSGTCTGGTNKVCAASDQCHDPGTCNTSTGACSNPVKAGTPACNDGLTCNVGETCQAGVCTGGSALDCSASATDDCHAGQCNEPGGCFSQPLTGNACDDGNACTTGTHCSAGTCNGGTSLGCDDGDPCTTDSCNPGSGCVHVAATDGTPCATDTNPCTRDTCLGGLCHRPSPPGTSCGAAASCTGTPPSAVATPPGTCDGTTTTCQQAPIACGTQPCNGTTCLGSCTADAQCSGTQFCDLVTGQCKAKVGTGGSCSRTAMCNGLTCVDSVCCTSACAGGTTDCQTCNGTSPGTCTPLANNAACDDGVFCNGADKCAAGACTVHPGNPCPGADGDANCAESCNETSNSCNLADPNGSACNDGLFCNVGETCQAGVCQGGTAADCSTFTDTCNTGICNEALAACQAQPIPGSIPCNADNTVCTANDQCLSGTCTAGPPLNCNDTNACTTDSCSPTTGCAHVNLTGPACTVDGNPCTLDTCVAGVCNTAVPNGSSCGPPPSCTGTIPNAVATPAGSCTGGSCVQTPVPCGPTTPCNGTACQGGCANDTQCPSGFFCNTAVGGQCQAVKPPGGSCSRDGMCQSGTTCVDTVCCRTACGGGNPADCVTCNGTQPGTCTNLTGTACDDGAFCTGADTCQAGACTGHTGDPCPGADGDANCKESCNEATDTCDANDPAGSTCDDGQFCTVGEKCNTGACGGGTARDCSASGNQCNTASCDETNDQCKATPLDGNACNDGSSCTSNDKCVAGTCTGTSACDDGNPCTDDSCGAGNTCIHTANTAPCDDLNKCTTNDTCSNKACVGGPALVCDDGKACTDDTCVPATGCKATNDDTNTCSDGDGCTTGDHCVSGACVPTGGKSCDDDNPCTDDTCNAGGTCVNTANTAACDDGNACTTNDKCANKACVAGPARVCDDGKACTDDSCDPTTGCKAVNDDANTCSDGNACTNADHCTAGTCVGGAVSCNDQNPCTDDSCNPATGCAHANNTIACDDADACTTGDKCAGGNCVGGAALTCDDGKVCTVDKCVAATGCVFTAGNPGLPCRAANGVCDDPETCDGTNANCPTDRFNTGRTCSAASCTLGQATPPGVCSGGSATCPTVTPVSCGNYVCSGTGCGSTCTTSNDCAQGSFCDASHHCNDKGQNGDPCSSGGQCASTFCVDGVCCNDDCSGQCEACNLAASRGTCTPVLGTPVSPRAACPGTDPTCKGTCNGIDTLACAVPDGSVQCRAASCNAATNQVTPAAFCNAGSCPVATTASCAPSICVGSKCSGCATDVQCGAGKFCDLAAGLCKVLLPPGDDCTRDRECGTGQCVDHVCCNSDCTGQCETCAAPDSRGTCTPVTGAPVGRKPCSGAPGVCAGTCDGTTRGSCVYPGPGTVCTAPHCSENRATAVAFCDGAGTCPPDDQVDCPAGCDGDACAGDCACTLDERCVAGRCIPAKQPGDPCSSGEECSSSYCADGVCCYEACTGQCEACNLPGTVGICTAVSGAPKGSRQPCATDGSACAGVCDGTTRTGCAYAGATTQCRAASCTDGVATLRSTCQGNGSCGPLQLQDCAPNQCSTTTPICAGGCTKDTDCTAAQFCSGGVCIPKLGQGTPCGGNTQCATTHCVDGVCCNAACDGQCEACDQATKIGTCSGVSGAPRGGRPACAGSGACGGFCSPSNPATCTLPTSTTACGIASCQDGVSIDVATCENAVCVTPAPTFCDPFICADTGDVCVTSCIDASQCLPGLLCVDGNCVPPPSADAGVDAGADAGTRSDASAGGFPNAPDAGAGGSAGSGGAAGRDAGTKPGTGGAVGPDGGIINGPDASTPPNTGIIDGRDRGSCGCRVPGTNSGDPSGAVAALLLGGLLGLRRRRAATRSHLR